MKNKQIFRLDNSNLIRFSSAGLSKQRTYTLPDADAQLAGDVLSSSSETTLTGLLKGNGSVVSAITTSSELASVISDETGSGLLVFATSPSLTTPNIGSATATKVLNADGTAAAPTYTFTSDTDTGLISSAANAIGIVTGGTEHWTFNSSGAINPTSDSTKDIGNLSVNPRDIHVSRSFIKKGIDTTGGYGQLALKSISASKTLTNAQTNTLAVQIPAGTMIVGIQLRNDTAVVGVDDATGLVPITTYSAIYATGATQTINATIAVAINTKTNKFFDSNAATNITSAATDVTLDAGVGNKFTAGGIISAVAYYYELTSITDAS